MIWSSDKQKIAAAWADNEVKNAIETMLEEKMEVSPESLSVYFEKNFELPFSTGEAAEWLAAHGV